MRIPLAVALLAAAACTKKTETITARTQAGETSTTVPAIDPGAGDGTGTDVAAALGEFAIDAVADLPGQTSFTLTWSAAANATAYDVIIGADAACAAATPTFPDLASATVNSPRLAAGDHFACVTAKDGKGGTKSATNNGVKIRVPANKRPTAGKVTLAAIASPFIGGAALSVAGKIEDFADPDADPPVLDLGANDCGVEIQHDDGALDFTVTKAAMGDKPCTINLTLKDAGGPCTACTPAQQKLGYIGPVKDINAGAASSLNRAVDPHFVALGTKALFAAGTRAQGSELWLTDGTDEGTSPLKALASDDGSSPPAVVLGAYAYFRGTDAAYGAELWRTDGTPEGTTLVKDIAAGAAGSSPDQLTIFGGKVYFSADDGVAGRELWVSDGTAAGTALVKDINAGAVSGNPRNFAAAGSLLFFAATTAANGTELWKTNGTAAGTAMVADLNAGAGGSNPEQIIALGTNLIFVATTPASGTELFISANGSTAAVLREIGAGAASGDPHELTVVGTKLFFRATDAANGTELFKSDGTTGGTVLVANINAGAASSTPTGLTAMNGNLYFFADDGSHGRELFISDGTSTGMLKDLNPGGNAVDLAMTPALFADGTTLYFGASDGAKGLELYKTNGTTATTVFVKDLFDGAQGSDPAHFAKVGAHIVFAAADAHGREPWITDGTADGTKMIKDIADAGTADSVPAPGPLAALSRVVNTGTVVFSADDGTHGLELWKTNGTAAGTSMIADVRPGARGSALSSHRPIALTDSKIIFAADDGVHGMEPWITDLTAAGTNMIKDLALDAAGSNPANFLKCNGLVYFTADDAVGGVELFNTDGTPGHTGIVQNLKFGAKAGSNPTDLACMGTSVFFAADGSTGADPGTPKGVELWKWDGTVATLVKDIVANAGGSFPHNLLPIGGQLYFAATNTGTNTELWVSDGTGPNTSIVKEINSSTTLGSDPQNFIVLGDLLLFVANDGSHGRELWRSDGTSSGTTLVKDLLDGAGSSNPLPLATMGGLLYFFATDAGNKMHLYKTDGSANGTLPVTPQDFRPLAAVAAAPEAIARSSGSYLYFQADDGEHGRELWRSDGTADGTAMLADIGPGAASSQAWSPLYYGYGLLFEATIPDRGRELFQFLPPPE